MEFSVSFSPLVLSEHISLSLFLYLPTKEELKEEEEEEEEEEMLSFLIKRERLREGTNVFFAEYNVVFGITLFWSDEAVILKFGGKILGRYPKPVHPLT